MLKVLATLFLLAVAAPALAAEYPLFAPERLHLGAGINYVRYDNEDEPLTFRREAEIGVYAAYVLTPHVALAGSSVYGLDSKLVRTSIGVRLTIFRGGGS